MVDFQSRDTRRSVEDDSDEPAGDTTDETDARSEAGETSPDGSAGEATEPDESVPALSGYAVVSIGSSRTIDDDAPGDAVVEEIDAADNSVVTREVIDASYDGVQSDVEALAHRQDVMAVVTAGGTGVEPDDVTVEAVEPLLDRQLPGFGELLRDLCWDSEGSAVVRTRATAGTIEGVPVFCLPGQASLARRGVRELVVPEAETIHDLASEDGE